MSIVRRIATLVVLVSAGAFGACTLNPQPIPPGATAGADAGAASPPAVAEPNRGLDSGKFGGDSQQGLGDSGDETPDATTNPTVDASTDAADDATDGAADAPDDGPLDATQD